MVIRGAALNRATTFCRRHLLVEQQRNSLSAIGAALCSRGIVARRVDLMADDGGGKEATTLAGTELEVGGDGEREKVREEESKRLDNEGSAGCGVASEAGSSVDGECELNKKTDDKKEETNDPTKTTSTAGGEDTSKSGGKDGEQPADGCKEISDDKTAAKDVNTERGSKTKEETTPPPEEEGEGEEGGGSSTSNEAAWQKGNLKRHATGDPPRQGGMGMGLLSSGFASVKRWLSQEPRRGMNRTMDV